MKAAEGRHPGGGLTTTPRGDRRKAFSKWTNESPASSCSAARNGLPGVAVKRELSEESAARAGMVEPCPRSRVKGWAKVNGLALFGARSLSLSTACDAPATCRPEARSPASPCENVEAVSTQGPPPGRRPALRRTSPPRCIWARISPEIPASDNAATLMGT